MIVRNFFFLQEPRKFFHKGPFFLPWMIYIIMAETFFVLKRSSDGSSWTSALFLPFPNLSQLSICCIFHRLWAVSLPDSPGVPNFLVRPAMSFPVWKSGGRQVTHPVPIQLICIHPAVSPAMLAYLTIFISPHHSIFRPDHFLSQGWRWGYGEPPKASYGKFHGDDPTLSDLVWAKAPQRGANWNWKN